MSLSGLLPLLREVPEYTNLAGRMVQWRQQARAVVLPGLPLAARPYVIAALHRDVDASLLVIVPQAEEAKRLHEQVTLWVDRPENILLYPEPDILPYERVPSGDLSVRQRMAVLARLGGLSPHSNEDAPVVVVASARAAMHRTLPLRDLAGRSRVIRSGQAIAPANLLQQWLSLGYDPVTLVELPGQMSRRGGIIDIFPVTSPGPVRLEFFGDIVDSLRSFDAATQRSTGVLDAVMVTPPAEVLPELAERVADVVEGLDRSSLSEEVQHAWGADVERLRHGADGATSRELWQFYAPYFHSMHRPTTLIDHFDGIVITLDETEVEAAAARLEAEAVDLKAGKEQRGEIIAQFPAPFEPWTQINGRIATLPRLYIETQQDETMVARRGTVVAALPFLPSPVYGGRLKQVLDDCLQRAGRGERVVITSHQAMRLSALLQERDAYAMPQDRLETAPDAGSLTLVQGSVFEGWTLGAVLTVLTDVEMFGWAKPRRGLVHQRAASPQLLSELVPGDFVVHIEHGVGIYRGLTRMNLDGVEREYLQLDYAQNDKLYLPSDQIDRVSRYVGVGDTSPTLTTLGSADWEHAKRRAQKAVQDVARDLLAIYAARQVAPGNSFSPDGAWQNEMEASFPYIETPDQLRAIGEVKQDMERPQPMDRLICGDVGYGKTEVALRAAFKAVTDGRQVAILVPTTILAQQHYNTFRERLAAFPVRVDMLSRFRHERAQRRIVASLADGSIDICIGTHRLIQKDIVFKNLGLVIIDEEQRFGVLHKERLKQLRQQVDVLTLTATPIPRTLHMSLVGVRDMSVIDTPPEDRLPITTVVSPYDENVIRQAIMRELDRGGQVYFVHNRVQSIGHVADRLQNLLPTVSFAVGHGQMPEDDLERVMEDFAQGKTDVLICTAIIESGVDIPNANTIIINRADQFGLAQLYQLRGRVGRGANRAYAYLLHDRSFQLSETAERRLRAIFEASSLGAGYRIAMKDLEIRGAGNILGVEQHGQIAAIGFDLYTRLLAAEIERLKREGFDEERLRPERVVDLPSLHPAVTLPLDASLPASYIDDDSTRLALYQRMAGLDSLAAVEDMRREVTDRFGKPPTAVEDLYFVLQVRARAERAGVASVAAHDHEVVLKMREGASIRAQNLAPFAAMGLKMGAHTLRFDRRRSGGHWREHLTQILDALAS